MRLELSAKIDSYLQHWANGTPERETFPFIFQTVTDEPFENNIEGLKILGPQMGKFLGAIGTREAITQLDQDPRIHYVEASHPVATLDSAPQRISVTPKTG